MTLKGRIVRDGWKDVGLTRLEGKRKSLTCREFRFMTAFSLPHKANLLRNYLIYNFFKSEQFETRKISYVAHSG